MNLNAKKLCVTFNEFIFIAMTYLHSLKKWVEGGGGSGEHDIAE
jgi:hypothetical protein